MKINNRLEYKIKKYKKDKYDNYNKYKNEILKINFLFEKENLLYKLEDFNKNVDKFLKKFKK
jgi:hypothetical protein